MSIDGKLLSKARGALEELKSRNIKELERRRAQVYRSVPEALEIEAQLRALMAEVIGTALQRGQDPAGAIERAENRSLDLQMRRAELLVDAGFPIDYIDEKYMCPNCRDSGFVDGKMCDCLKALYDREVTSELSSLLKLGEETFETFDLRFYSSVPDPASGISPRDIMEEVFELCRDYASRFGANSDNLLFQGATGLGKTFLTACIARVVSKQGFSVVYDTAVSIFEAFESQRFSRDQSLTEAASLQIRRYLDCDLLIIDDLGTEMSSALTSSALYTLINSRLINQKKTIISTNLKNQDLNRRYIPQITSRLEGEYLNLSFVGDDIRAIKKERGLNEFPA